MYLWNSKASLALSQLWMRDSGRLIMDNKIREWINEEGWNTFEEKVRDLLEEHEAVNPDECILAIMGLLYEEMEGSDVEDNFEDDDMDDPEDDLGPSYDLSDERDFE